jgi:xylulokinase
MSNGVQQDPGPGPTGATDPGSPGRDGLLLGIDLGTGSSKAVLARADGTVVATAVVPRPNSVSMVRPGWAEVDPVGIWWADVVRLCRELLPQAGGAPIAGVCVSGVGPCLVLCDDSDTPVRPAILYGIDTRATAEIDELTARYGAEAILARGGTALSTQAVGPKALWVQRHEPQVWARATRWYNSHSFVVRRLTGEYVLDHHTASQCDPAYDLTAQDWSVPWYDEVFRLPAPRLAWPAEVVGAVTATAAEQTGLPAGTPVSAGTVDAWAEAFSAGVRAPGDLMLMYGSTLFFVAVAPPGTATAARDPLLWTTAGVERGTLTRAAGMSTSGSLTGWVSDLTGGIGFDQLVGEAAAVPPGSDGLLVLPYFAGERTPVFDPRARGVVAGLHLRHTRAHLFRAVYEGIGFGIRQILALLDDPPGAVSRVVAVGGGTQGSLWTQVVSDITGREQTVPEQAIGAGYGDALLAAIGTGLVPPDTDWTVPGRTVVPSAASRDVYDGLYDQYRNLYPATRHVVHHLAQLQESAQPDGPAV